MAGDLAAADEHLTQAIELYRELALSGTPRYMHCLVRVLENRCLLYTQMGRQPEATQARTGAQQVREALREQSPTRFDGARTPLTDVDLQV